MKVEEIGSRGVLFSFYDLDIRTNVFAIVCASRFYIVDTYLGPDIMEKVDEYLIDNFGKRERVIINTHSDWDHVWGNCYFDGKIIIAHRDCYLDMKKNGSRDLEKYKEYIRGEVVLKLPNLVFDDSISFLEDGIDIYHSMGHSKDSITVVDRVDRVLYAGDNLEYPIPYTQWLDLKSYIDSLNFYLKEDVDIFIGGHTGIEDLALVKDNKKYLLDLYNEKDIKLDSGIDIHKENIKILRELKKG